MNIEYIGSLLLAFFGGGGVFVLLIIWFIHDFEKFEKFFSKLLNYITWIYSGLEYSRAANEIQGAINTSQKNINRQAALVLPHAVKIEFARNAKDVETYLRKGEVIVTMGHSKDRDRDLVVSTLAYVKKDLVTTTRSYVDKAMMTATDFTVAKDILEFSKHHIATSMLISDCLEPELNNNPELKTNYILLGKINKIGYFYRIFLIQLKYLGDKLFPSIATMAVQNEVKEFATFLVKIVEKGKGEYANLDFIKSRIRVKVMLIAKEETRVRGTIDYDRRVRKAHSDGIEYIYICAWGEENCQLARTVASEEVRAGRVTIIDIDIFERFFDDGGKTKAICIPCAVNLKLTIEETLAAPGVLTQLLEQHIDELRDGKIEVCSVGRKPGILSKVAVRGLVDGIDAVECIHRRISAGDLATILGNERIHVIQYDDDEIKFIMYSLFPVEVKDIENVSLNTKERSAEVTLREETNISKAIGRDGSNVRTASLLTGWRIRVRK